MQLAEVERALKLNKVEALQDVLLTMPQVHIVTTHTFLAKIYERRIDVPPWTVLTGAAHKTAYTVRLESGTIAVNTDEGVKVLTGPMQFEVAAGMQRAGCVFDDPVVWVDVYENLDNCEDINALEERLYVVPEVGMMNSRTPEQWALIKQKELACLD